MTSEKKHRTKTRENLTAPALTHHGKWLTHTIHI